jgi:hypothetical protein
MGILQDLHDEAPGTYLFMVSMQNRVAEHFVPLLPLFTDSSCILLQVMSEARASRVLRHCRTLPPVMTVSTDSGAIVLYPHAGGSLEEVREEWYSNGLSTGEIESKCRQLVADILPALLYMHEQVCCCPESQLKPQVQCETQ